MKRYPAPVFVFFLVFFLSLTGTAFSAEIFLSAQGNDRWSGSLPSANEAQTDGPVASFARAQELWRAAQASATPGETVTVFLRNGSWFLDKPVVLNEQDRRVPLTIQPYGKERPILYGSLPLASPRWIQTEINGLKVWETTLPPELVGQVPGPGRIFDGDASLRRARYPDFDEQNPYQGGFLYVARELDKSGKLGSSVGCIHNPGDSLTYDVEIPTTGTYCVWMFYGADNGQYKVNDVGDRMTVEIAAKSEEAPAANAESSTKADAQTVAKPVVLSGVTNTGAWTPSRWTKCAVLNCPAGKAQFKWTNQRGGGINIGGFILTLNDSWDPNTSKTLEEPTGKPTLIIPADTYSVGVGKQLSVVSAGSKDAFRAQPGDLKTDWANPDVDLHIFQSGSCRAFKEIVQIRSIDEATGSVSLFGKECGATLAKGDRYYLENSRDFISAPGEWFLNRKTGVLTVCPLQADAAPSRLKFAVAGTLIQVQQETKEVSNLAPVVLDGLTFAQTAHTRDDGCIGYSMGERGVIELNETTKTTVQNCRFLDCGRYAVRLRGGQGNAVQACQIQRSCQGGVLLIESTDNRITDCWMKDIGLEYKHIGGVVLELKSARNLISHNFIQNSSRYGISLKNAGTENIIEFNDIRDISLETFDTGAIEVTQGDKDQLSGSIIRNNRILNTNGYSCQGPNMPLYMSWGIYLDSFAGGYLVENNYVYGTSNGGFMFQGGKGNVLRNNMFRNGAKYQGYFTNHALNSENLVFDHNIVTFENPDASLFILGRELKNAIKSADYNLIWFRSVDDKSAENEGNPKSVAEFPGYKAWKTLGFDEHGLIVDPQLTNPALHEGLLNPESPAIKAGFKQLDLSTVGPRVQTEK